MPSRSSWVLVSSTGCPLADRRVVGVGPPGARIALVGEAPGEGEERLGVPFVGASGRLLDKMLSAAGIQRSACYITNVSKVRPSRNDFAERYREKGQPTPELRVLWDELRDELLAVKPNVIVALGAEALEALTGKKGITDWRGSLQQGIAGKTIGTLHPAYVCRMYEARRIVEHDLRRALEESSVPELELPEHEFQVDPSFEQAMGVLGWLTLSGKTVSFDIETLGPRIRCLGFAWSASEAICIPFTSSRAPASLEDRNGSIHVPAPTDTPFRSHWSEKEELELLHVCNTILSNPAQPLIAQNFPFDASYLEREFGIVCRGLAMDTMVAQHCCYSELPKSLNFLCSFYTRTPCYWQYNASSDLETWRYNCYDCAVTWEVAQVLEQELKELQA